MKKILQPVAKILAGTASAQAISILLIPIISRIYTPYDYGVFGVFVAISGVISIVASMQFHQAIVLPKTTSHALGLACLSSIGAVAGAIITTIITSIYFLVLKDSIYNPFQFSITIGLVILISGVSQSFQSLAIRFEKFSVIGAAAIIRTVFTTGFQIIFGLADLLAMGLMLGYVIGEFLALMFLVYKIRPQINLKQSNRLYIKMYALFVQYRDFSTFGTAQEALNSASQGLPTIILGIFFGPLSAGYYSFAMRVLLAPGQLLSNAVRQVFSQRFAVNLRVPEVVRKDFTIGTLSIAVPTLILTVAILPWLGDLFAAIFGEQWRVSGEYGEWLILWVAFLIFNAPSSVIFRILRRQKQNFFLNVLIIATRIACLLLGGMVLNDNQTIVVFSLVGVFWNIVYIYLAWRLTNDISKEIL